MVYIGLQSSKENWCLLLPEDEEYLEIYHTLAFLSGAELTQKSHFDQVYNHGRLLLTEWLFDIFLPTFRSFSSWFFLMNLFFEHLLAFFAFMKHGGALKVSML